MMIINLKTILEIIQLIWKIKPKNDSELGFIDEQMFTKLL